MNGALPAQERRTTHKIMRQPTLFSGLVLLMSGASNVFVNAQNTQTVAFVGSAIYLANEAQRPKNCGDSIPTPALMNSAGQTSFAFDLTCGSRRLSAHGTDTYPSSGVTGALDGQGGFVLVNPVSLGKTPRFTSTRT